MSGVKPHVFPNDLRHPLSPSFHLFTRTQCNPPLLASCTEVLDPYVPLLDVESVVHLIIILS